MRIECIDQGQGLTVAAGFEPCTPWLRCPGTSLIPMDRRYLLTKGPRERRADSSKVRIRVRVRVIVTPEYAHSDNFGLSDTVYQAFGLSDLRPSVNWTSTYWTFSL